MLILPLFIEGGAQRLGVQTKLFHFKLFNSYLSIKVQNDKIEVQIGKLNKTVNLGHSKAKVLIYRGTLHIETKD